jgi:hypothetical protein
MKALFTAITATAMAAVFAGAAQAADVVRPAAVRAPIVSPCTLSGVGGFYWLWGKASGYSVGTGSGLGGYGKANLCAGNHGVQLDTYGEVVSASSGDFDNVNDGQFGGVAHLYARDPGHAFGVILGVEHQFDSYDYHNPGMLGVFGADAHLYMGNFTLAGQAVYFKSFGQDPNNVDPEHGWTASAEGRFFISPNAKLTGLLGFHSDVDINTVETSNDFFYGVGGELQVAGSPFSLFANVTRHQNVIDGTKFPTTVVRVGGAVHFNQPSLLAEDRNGASFSTPFIDSFTNLVNGFYR